MVQKWRFIKEIPYENGKNLKKSLPGKNPKSTLQELPNVEIPLYIFKVPGFSILPNRPVNLEKTNFDFFAQTLRNQTNLKIRFDSNYFSS